MNHEQLIALLEEFERCRDAGTSCNFAALNVGAGGFWDRLELGTVGEWLASIAIIIALVSFLQEWSRRRREHASHIALWPTSTPLQWNVTNTSAHPVYDVVLEADLDRKDGLGLDGIDWLIMRFAFDGGVLVPQAHEQWSAGLVGGEVAGERATQEREELEEVLAHLPPDRHQKYADAMITSLSLAWSVIITDWSDCRVTHPGYKSHTRCGVVEGEDELSMCFVRSELEDNDELPNNWPELLAGARLSFTDDRGRRWTRTANGELKAANRRRLPSGVLASS